MMLHRFNSVLLNVLRWSGVGCCLILARPCVAQQAELFRVGLARPASLIQESAAAEVSPSDRVLAEQQAGENAGESAETPAQEEAKESLAPAQNRPLTLKITAVDISTAEIGTGVLPQGEVPSNPQPLPGGMEHADGFLCVHWRASEICHYPLYFEDAMLERHGHRRFGNWQPLAAGVRFYSTIALLPYLKSVQPTCETKYALGHFRPGTCSPMLVERLPYDRRAAVVETLSLAGFFWAAPL